MRSAKVLTGRSFVGRHFVFAAIAAFGAVMAPPAQAQVQSGLPSVSSAALKAEFRRLLREKRHHDAADIDGRRCRQLVRHARRIVDGITMYVNANDWALWVSQKLHGKERCGGKAQLFKGVDTIDTTGLGSGNSLRALWPGNWNHNVFAHNPLLFGEITRLLLNGKRPVHRRTPEFVKVTNRDGKAFWKYDPKLNIYEAVAKATNR